MPDRRFAQSPDFYMEDLHEEMLLYKCGTHKAVYLNETAALVWKLCDGQRTVGQIAAILTESFPASKDQVTKDVQHAVEMLSAEGALSQAG